MANSYYTRSAAFAQGTLARSGDVRGEFDALVVAFDNIENDFGLAEDWANKTGSTVDGSEYSAKEYAVGTTVPAGSSKTWATASAASAASAATSESNASDSETAAAASAASLPDISTSTAGDFIYVNGSKTEYLFTSTPAVTGIQFPTSGTVPGHSEGLITYDFDVQTFIGYVGETEITMNFGEELWTPLSRNNTGDTITNGEIVYISGSVGQNPTFGLAKADVRGTSQIVGVATHDIENNTSGRATTFGAVRGLNLSAFSEGDCVWLSPTTAGTFTATKPTGTNYPVRIGTVLNNSATVGVLLVHITQPVDSTDIPDVYSKTEVDSAFVASTALSQLAVKNMTHISNAKNFDLLDIVRDASSDVCVAVGRADGSDAYLITSSDTVTWTERANPKNFDLHAVTSNGANTYCAVGAADGTDSYLITAGAGATTWTERTNPKNVLLRGIVFAESTWVAVGNSDGVDAYVITATGAPPTTWTERSTPVNTNLLGVAHDGTDFCAVGGSGSTPAVMTSPDGTTWTDRSGGVSGMDSSFLDITYGNGLFVAVGGASGAGGHIFTSPDGITWIERSYAKSSANQLNSVTWDGTLFVAAGQKYTTANDATGIVISSPDGITWSDEWNSDTETLNSVTSTNRNSILVCGDAISGGSDAALAKSMSY